MPAKTPAPQTPQTSQKSEPREWAIRRDGDPETPTTTSPTSPPPEPITEKTLSAGSPEQLPDDMRSQLEKQARQHAEPLGPSSLPQA